MYPSHHHSPLSTPTQFMGIDKDKWCMVIGPGCQQCRGLSGAWRVAGVDVKQQAAELQSSVQVARRETQVQAELAGQRSDSAYSRIEAQGQVSAQAVQKAGDRVASAIGTSSLTSVLPTAIEETVEAVSEFQQVLSEATGDLVSQTLASITGADTERRSGLSSITAPMADPSVPEPGEEGEEGATAVADPGAYKGLNAFVAGAGGRTGRLIVERLARKGVPVRAMVRLARKEKELGTIMGVQVGCHRIPCPPARGSSGVGRVGVAQVVEGDLYKYESLKAALGER